jgi:hypothetical protein
LFYIISLASYIILYAVATLILEIQIGNKILKPIIDLTERIKNPKEMNERIDSKLTTQSHTSISGPSSAMSIADYDAKVSHKSVIETGINLSSSARSINEKDSFFNSASKLNQSNSKIKSRSQVPVAKSFMKEDILTKLKLLEEYFSHSSTLENKRAKLVGNEMIS